MVTEGQLTALLTVRDVARILHIHPNTLRRWSDKGLIKAYRITGRGDRRFSQKEVERFIMDINENPQLISNNK